MIIVLAALAIVLGGGAVYQVLGSRADLRRYRPPGAFADIDGQRLHVVSAGSGTPAVVFESGVAASSLSWTRVLPDVATMTSACAYDRAGLAWSDRPRHPRSVSRLVGELRGVIAAVSGGEPCVLVAHSFGALLACACLFEHPAEIAGVVLLDPPTDWRNLTRPQARLLRVGRQLSRLGGILAHLGVVRACLALLTGGAPGVPRHFVRIFGPTAARTVEHLVGEVRKLPPEIHPVVQMHWCQPKCFAAMADHLTVLSETARAADRLTTAGDIPFVVISAGDQPPAVVAAHQRLARVSSQGRHLVAERSGHWIQFDQPDLVIAAIRDVVDRVRRNSGSRRWKS